MVTHPFDTTVAERCPCCHDIRSHGRPITDRYGFTWPLMTCGHCGIEYQGRPMTDRARVAFYANGTYRKLVAGLGPQPPLLQAQAYYATRWRDRLPRVPPDRPILDFGGSTGQVSRSLFPNHDVIVADYGDGATITPDQALAVAPGHYHGILCCQTIDHLPDPLTILQSFAHVSSANAWLFVDVVKGPVTPYKLDHEWYAPTAAPFLALIERAGWRPLWLDAQTDRRHWAVLAHKGKA